MVDVGYAWIETFSCDDPIANNGLSRSIAFISRSAFANQ